MAINAEEHTITQSLVALDRPPDWKALESFAEYGSWHPDFVTGSLTRLVERPGRLWHGYHVWAVDDTKVHRTSKDVWGTCTFHEYTARCPNRAPTVRAHNWVVLGALLDSPVQPALFLPVAGQLYFRKITARRQGAADPLFPHQVPAGGGTDPRSRQSLPGSMGVFDGAYAKASVVRPLVKPETADPRVEVLSRLRPTLGTVRPAGTGRGPTKMGPPRPLDKGDAGRGRGTTAGVHLRPREGRALQGGAVLVAGDGADVTVKAVVAEVEGYKERFTLVCSATELTGLQIVELLRGGSGRRTPSEI